jgi:hypothetical protein
MGTSLGKQPKNVGRYKSDISKDGPEKHPLTNIHTHDWKSPDKGLAAQVIAATHR